MSKELLARVGQFLYGEQWQALLSREISVGERTMRRWAAGTDQVPDGVWRDICAGLENLAADLDHLLADVQRVRGLVEVHSFEVGDPERREMVQPRKSTAMRIARIGGRIVPGTAEWLPPWQIDAEGRARRINLAAPARIHANDRTYEKNSLYNAVCDVTANPETFATASIDSDDGSSYEGPEIDDIVRSPEFERHRAELAARGRTRD